MKFGWTAAAAMLISVLSGLPVWAGSGTEEAGSALAEAGSIAADAGSLVSVGNQDSVGDGAWENRNGLWYYGYRDGTHPSEEWLWLDGNRDGIAECYCFDRNGYMYAGESTPDGYWVNEQGAWTKMGVVQYRQVPVGTEYAEDGLLERLHEIAENDRETNQSLIPPEKTFTRFDRLPGDITVYYDDDDRFVYLTVHCREDAVSPIRGLDLKPDDNETVLSALASSGYQVEMVQYYKVRLRLSEGLYGEYKADTKFLVVGWEDTP